MTRDTKCGECGRLFDVSIVRAAFNERYLGIFDYDKRDEERLCFACACYMAETGRWRVEEDTMLWETPIGCRACGGYFPFCSDDCPAINDEGERESEKRTWYYFKATTPTRLDICLRMLHAEGIGFEIVMLPDAAKKLVYRIYPKTDVETYRKLYERYKALVA